MGATRYDGAADYYDERFASYGDLKDVRSSASHIARLLGRGSGWCLDVACGSGLHFAAIESTGRRVVGVDISNDQLRIARGRSRSLARAHVASLPFAGTTFETSTCTYLHTDTDDMAPVFAEMARVLRPGGRLVYLGLHPWMWGPNVERRADGSRVIHPGYMATGWHDDSPFWRRDGLSARVGGQRHVSIAELITGILSVRDLRLESVHEVDDGRGFADRIAMCARKV